MLLKKLSPGDKKNLSVEALRVWLEEEEGLLKDRLVNERKDVAFYQGAASFCKALRGVLQNK